MVSDVGGASRSQSTLPIDREMTTSSAQESTISESEVKESVTKLVSEAAAQSIAMDGESIGGRSDEPSSSRGGEDVSGSKESEEGTPDAENRRCDEPPEAESPRMAADQQESTERTAGSDESRDASRAQAENERDAEGEQLQRQDRRVSNSETQHQDSDAEVNDASNQDKQRMDRVPDTGRDFASLEKPSQTREEDAGRAVSDQSEPTKTTKGAGSSGDRSGAEVQGRQEAVAAHAEAPVPGRRVSNIERHAQASESEVRGLRDQVMQTMDDVLYGTSSGVAGGADTSAPGSAVPGRRVSQIEQQFGRLAGDVKAQLDQVMLAFQNVMYGPPPQATLPTAPPGTLPVQSYGMMPTLPTFQQPVAEQRPTSVREQSIGASDTLGSYFRGSNKNVVVLDDIKKLSADTTGTVPPEVKKAAQFMLDHPGVWKKIETHDVKNADNVAGVSNFAAYSKSAKDTLAASAQSSDALAGYFRGINKDVVNLDDIKKLAADNSKTVPEDVKKAAQFMVNHPNVWSQIETRDVKGRDDISGVANFEAFSKATKANLAAPVESADVLAKHFRGANQGVVTFADIKKLAADDSKTVPEDVKKAAQFMVDNKSVWTKIETRDVKRLDDIAGVSNFEAFSRANRAA